MQKLPRNYVHSKMLDIFQTLELQNIGQFVLLFLCSIPRNQISVPGRIALKSNTCEWGQLLGEGRPHVSLISRYCSYYF